MSNIFQGIVCVFIVAAIVFGVAYGYVANIISLVTGAESTGMVLGRFAGVLLAPVGVILGYF